MGNVGGENRYLRQRRAHPCGPPLFCVAPRFGVAPTPRRFAYGSGFLLLPLQSPQEGDQVVLLGLRELQLQDQVEELHAVINRS